MASAELERREAFVLRPEQIQRLWSLLEASIGRTRATIYCAHQVKIDHTDVKQLLDYENASERHVVRLAFSSHSDDYEQTAALDFGGYVPVRGSVDAPEPVATRLRDDLADVISGTRAWYSRVAKLDLGFLMLVLLVVAMTIAQAMTPAPSSPRPALSFRQAALVVAVIGGGILAIATVWFALRQLQRRFFPISAFAFGQGAARYQFDEHVRWAIVVGFLVSCVASAFVALMLPAA